MTRLLEIYQNYLEKAVKVRKKASLFAGIFGMGDDPRKHPCHEAFYEAVEEWAEAFDPTDPVETLKAVQYIFQAPLAHEDNQDVYWFLFAAHTLTMPLIPALDSQDRQALAEWYKKAYPKRVRFPAQEQVLKCLETGRMP